MRYDLTGKKFNRFHVISIVGNDNRGELKWLCRCECGVEKIILSSHLRNNRIKSCGCLNDELKRARAKHRMHGTRFYNIWKQLRQRCNNPDSPGYKFYGERGIKISERWDTFLNFKDDMYELYISHCELHGDNNTSLDRINTKGNYSPENCRWATDKEQGRNTRTNTLITYNNKTQCLSAWEEELKMTKRSISVKLHRGWSLERIFHGQ